MANMSRAQQDRLDNGRNKQNGQFTKYRAQTNDDLNGSLSQRRPEPRPAPVPQAITGRSAAINAGLNVGDESQDPFFNGRPRNTHPAQTLDEARAAYEKTGKDLDNVPALGLGRYNDMRTRMRIGALRNEAVYDYTRLGGDPADLVGEPNTPKIQEKEAAAPQTTTARDLRDQKNASLRRMREAQEQSSRDATEVERQARIRNKRDEQKKLDDEKAHRDAEMTAREAQKPRGLRRLFGR